MVSTLHCMKHCMMCLSHHYTMCISGRAMPLTLNIHEPLWELKRDGKTTFLVLPNFHSRFYNSALLNSIETERCSLFLNISLIMIIIIILLTVKRSSQLIEPASYILLQVPAQKNKITIFLARCETSCSPKSLKCTLWLWAVHSDLITSHILIKKKITTFCTTTTEKEENKIFV